jgi:hypothetical protein
MTTEEQEGERIPISWKDIGCNALFSCSPPEILYHYTNLDGAAGIIQNASFWLTKFTYLNDKTELHYAIRLFQDEVRAYVATLDNVELNNFLSKAGEQLECFEKTNLCIGCFCENGDLLSQWRAYGHSGNGMALGFNSKKLDSFKSTKSIHLWKCVYAWEQQIRIVKGLLQVLVNSFNVISKGKDRNDNWEKTKSDLTAYFNTTFLRVAPVLKNAHFQEEQEWRLITSSVRCDDENYCVRISSERVSQYYNLSFCTGESQKKFIRRVMVGPSDKASLTVDAFGTLLRQHKYLFDGIDYSQIPFRDC